MDIDPASEHAHPWGDAATPYEAAGGEDGVRALTEAFYDVIEAESPSLRAMLPRDTSGSRRKLFEFLSGWLGGPPLYEERHGHPRLRLRHLPFAIGRAEAEEWTRCMRVAAEATVPEPTASWMVARLGEVAVWMVNQTEPGVIVPTPVPPPD